MLASLLLRHVVLRPGQALFMPAGGIHAYLRGVGVELLGNSDNVLRAALTAKHVDVAELLRLVDPDVAVPVLTARPVSPGISVYEAEVPEFRLYRLDLTAGAVDLPGAGPRIALCLDGGAVLTAAAGPAVTLGRGTGCFVPAATAHVRVTGPATVYVATVG